MSRFVVCYDVADNKRRYKVAACLRWVWRPRAG